MTTLTPAASSALPTPVEAKNAVPVKWCAGLGAGWLLVMVYMWTRWLAGGHAKTTPIGPTPVPTWQTILVRVSEFGFVAGAIPVLYYFMWKPWRAERRLTLDGMLIIAFVTSWAIQDCWIDYTRTFFTYNADLINLGCPQCFVPGWQASNQISEPLLWGPGVYISGLFMGTVVCCRVMGWFKARRPHTGTMGLIGVAWAFMVVFDVFAELIWQFTRVYTYPGAPRSISLFPGSTRQYPITEGIFWGATWAGFACLRYFKNDRGETVAERGAHDLAASPRRKLVYRTLAVIAGLNMIYLCVYNIPMQWFDMHQSAWPRSITSRSYLTDRSCGLGTNVLCPSQRVPAPVSPTSAYVTIGGRLHAPKGLPTQPPSAR
jgi:Spirocyclase AveC-like